MAVEPFAGQLKAPPQAVDHAGDVRLRRRVEGRRRRVGAGVEGVDTYWV